MITWRRVRAGTINRTIFWGADNNNRQGKQIHTKQITTALNSEYFKGRSLAFLYSSVLFGVALLTCRLYSKKLKHENDPPKIQFLMISKSRRWMKAQIFEHALMQEFVTEACTHY